MPWFKRADIDGFFALALDNLVQLLIIVALCRYVLEFPDSLIYQAILPGVALSVLLGNLYYAWLAKKIARQEQRDDVCALPYGINTVSLFAFVFLVMLPAKLIAQASGIADPARVAWQAGLLACFGSGLIELGGAFVAKYLRRITPRAALLSTLAGIALSFISLGFLFRTYANPVVGLTTLAVIMLVFFGRVQFKGNIPAGLVAVILGTALAWIIGLAPVGEYPDRPLVLAFPLLALGDLLTALSIKQLLTYASVIIPMGLFNLIGSLQNIESAEAAGDSYPTTPALTVNGLGSLCAALFGSCFPTTIYIGHPGFKILQAGAGYSILSGLFISIICMTGSLAYIAWLMPIDAGMAIVLWIGIVITAQAFRTTPSHHAPAVIIGLLPGIAAWGALLAKSGLRAAGLGTPERPFSNQIVGHFQQVDIWIDGAFALEQGFVLTAIILSATTVMVIERRFIRAALWIWSGAIFSALGLMHSYQWTVGDTIMAMTPAWPWVYAYVLMGCCFFLAPWLTVVKDE